MTGRGNPPSCLAVSNDLSELARVAAWVQAWAELHNLPVQVAERIDLCSAEVVTNIITYAYDDRASHRISLRLERDGDEVTLQIEDDGGTFDPRQARELPRATSLETAQVGGWGIPIVRRFSDELRYQRCAGYNRLTLTFRHPSFGRIDDPTQQATE